MLFIRSLIDNLFQSEDISKVGKPAKIVERMVNQNTYDDIAQGKVGWTALC